MYLPLLVYSWKYEGWMLKGFVWREDISVVWEDEDSVEDGVEDVWVLSSELVH